MFNSGLLDKRCALLQLSRHFGYSRWFYVMRVHTRDASREMIRNDEKRTASRTGDDAGCERTGRMLKMKGRHGRMVLSARSAKPREAIEIFCPLLQLESHV